jgi:hypothetical protein
MQIRIFTTLITCTLLSAYNSEAKKVPKYIRDRFTNCYNEKNTSIKTFIEINGFYELKRLFHFCSGVGVNMICSDTLQHNIVFYEDGTFIYGFSELFPLNQGVYWGIYRIEGDTIITQYIYHIIGFYK